MMSYVCFAPPEPDWPAYFYAKTQERETDLQRETRLLKESIARLREQRQEIRELMRGN